MLFYFVASMVVVRSAVAFPPGAIYGRLQRNSNPYEGINQHDYNRLYLALKNAAANLPPQSDVSLQYPDELAEAPTANFQNEYPAYDAWSDIGAIYDAPFDDGGIPSQPNSQFLMSELEAAASSPEKNAQNSMFLQNLMDNFANDDDTMMDTEKRTVKKAPKTQITRTTPTPSVASTTTAAPPSTAAAASSVDVVPKVMAKGGQKEYAMLRPPTDFRRPASPWSPTSNDDNDNEVVQLKRAARMPRHHFISDVLTDELGKLKQ